MMGRKKTQTHRSIQKKMVVVAAEKNTDLLHLAVAEEVAVVVAVEVEVEVEVVVEVEVEVEVVVEVEEGAEETAGRIFQWVSVSFPRNILD